MVPSVGAVAEETGRGLGQVQGLKFGPEGAVSC